MSDTTQAVTSDPTPVRSPTPLDLGYGQLSPAVQAAYRRLAHYPGPMLSTAAAAAMLTADPPQTETTLGALRHLDLVETMLTGWRMPDPVRAHAQNLAAQHDDPTDHQAAVTRAVQTYLRWAAHLDTVIAPGRHHYAPVYHQLPRHAPDARSVRQAVFLVGVWADTLLAAQAAAADQGLHHLAWQFAEALTGYLTHAHDLGTWDWAVEIGLDSAGRCQDLGALARLRALRALRSQRSGHARQAVDNLSAAAALARRVGDTELQATLACDHGAALLAHGEPAQALTVLQQGLVLHATSPQRPRRRAQLERHLARAHTALGDHDQAAAHLARAAATAAELGDPDLLSRLSADRAELELERGQHHLALICLDHAAVWSMTRTPADHAHLHCLRAAAHLHAGHLDAARQSHQIAERLALQDRLDDDHPTLLQIIDLHHRLTAQAAAQEDAGE